MNSRAYVYLCVTALFWGGNSVAGKMAVGHVSPMMLTTLRWVFALVVILVLMTPQIRRDWDRIRKHWLQLLAYGAIGFTTFNALLYSALKYTSAINAVILQAGIPMLIFLFNMFWSLRHGKPAGPNPWRATTLEWQTPETPPRHGNWGPELPVVYRWAYEYGAPGNRDDFVPQNQPPAINTGVAVGHGRNVG